MSEAAPTAEGELARTPVAHLLVYALDRRLDGALVFSSPGGADGETVVQLDRGVPVKIKPGDRHALLGEMLLEAKAIDSATLEGALATTGLLGDVLLLTDRIERDVLERVAEAQFRRRMVRLFAYPSTCTYRFYKDQNPLADYGGDAACVDPIALIWAGVRAHGDASSLIDATLARLGDNPLRLQATTTVARFELDAEEAQMLEALAICPSLAGLTAAFPRAARRFVYALAITRQLESAAALSPLGVDPPPSSSQRSLPAAAPSPPASMGGLPAPPTSLGRLALRSTPHRVGAAAPDAPGAGERPFVSRRGKDDPSAITAPGATAEAADPADPAPAPISGVTPIEDHPLAALTPAELFWLAAEYMEQSDIPAAVEACALGRAKAPLDADLIALHVRARAGLDGADLRELTRELDAVVAANDVHVAARFYRAMLLRRLGDDAGSVRDLRRVVELEPGHEEAQRELDALSARGPADVERSVFGRISGT